MFGFVLNIAWHIHKYPFKCIFKVLTSRTIFIYRYPHGRTYFALLAILNGMFSCQDKKLTIAACCHYSILRWPSLGGSNFADSNI